MVNIKEMPYSKKYATVLDTVKLVETFVPPFIQQHLGEEAVAELQSIWQEGIKPIPEDASDEERVNYLLSRLKGVPWEKRSACFRCIIAIAMSSEGVEFCSGECRGFITFEPRGKQGFGYDPVFYLPELDKTMAELPLEIKNQVSHRGQAARKAHRLLERLWGNKCVT